MTTHVLHVAPLIDQIKHSQPLIHNRRPYTTLHPGRQKQKPNHVRALSDLIDQRDKPPARRRIVSPFLPERLCQHSFLFHYTVKKHSHQVPKNGDRYQCARDGDRKSWLNQICPQTVVAHNGHICQEDRDQSSIGRVDQASIGSGLDKAMALSDGQLELRCNIR